MELGQTALIIIFAMVLLIFISTTITSLIWSRRQRGKSVGALKIDTSDPDGPYMFLELHVPLNDVMDKKRVTLDVNVTNYISQK